MASCPSSLTLCGMKTYTVFSICCLLVLFQGCGGTCTYPSSLDGLFYSSHEGFLTWNATTFGTLTITTVSQTFSNLEFECFLNDGTYYIGRSESFIVYTASFYAYICLDLNKVSDNFYYYYYATAELSGANGARVKILPTATVVSSSSTICDEPTPYQDGSFSVLYKNGTSISGEATTCPTDIQGYYTYTLDDGSTTHCSNSSYLDVCTDTKQLTFNYAECNTTYAMYSASGQLYCLHAQTSGSTHYVILYNDDTTVDSSTTFRTVCMVFEKGSSGLSYATQYPKECQNSTVMNSTAVVSPGGSLVLTLNDSCPVSTTSTAATTLATTQAPEALEQTNTASVVGGTLGGLIAIAAVVVVVLGAFYFIKKKKASGKVGKAEDKEDIIPQSPRQNIIPQGHAETNSRTLFTPTNKIPNDDSDILSDRQITLSTSIDDVDGNEQGDGESLADEYGEIQADEIIMVSEKTADDINLVSEKTMMSTDHDQMTEASLPIYSETGDTPLPTDTNVPEVEVEDTGAAEAPAPSGADGAEAADGNVPGAVENFETTEVNPNE